LNKDYYSSPNSLAVLLQIISSHPKPQLRQLAAVEARKLVERHWGDVPADQKPNLREQLCQATLNEDVTLTRHSAGRVIASIASIDFVDGEWAELPGFLQQAATSQTARHREVGVYIIFTILEAVGDAFPGDVSNLYNLFSTTIRDPESAEVRANTMMALSRLAMLLDADEDAKQVKMFQDLVPSMVAVLEQAVKDTDDDHALQAFEVFQTLLGCDSALLQQHFGDLVKFMINLAAETNIEDDYRSQALAFLMQAVRYRKLKVQGLKIGEELTLKSLQIVTELGDITDEEDVTPARSALGLLDILASSLPPSQVVIPLLKALGPYFTSQNPDYRQAGILALGMCVEGAPDFIATQLNEILPAVLHLLEDPELKVRAAALNGIARLADDLAEEVAEEHARLIPAMVRNFDIALSALQSSANDERNIQIVKGSCHAIDSLIEGLSPEDAAKYVPELVPRFSSLFQHDDFKVKAAAIGAIGSIASAAEKAFIPYFEQTMHALAPYVTIKESQEDLDLRGVVCDSMGKMASAVGAEPFEPYVRPLMEASEEALHLDHPRLRETSYILWSTIAKVYEEGFAKYLPGAVKGLKECLNQDETDLEVQLGEGAKDLVGTEVVLDGRKVKVTGAGGDEDEDDDAIDMDHDDDGLDDIGVTAVAMEKEIAAEVFGDIITHTRREFLPFLEDTVQTLLELIEHPYEGIRKAALGTLWRTYACVWGLAEGNGMAKWVPGLPLKVQPSDDLKKLGNLVMAATMSVWNDEMDRYVANFFSFFFSLLPKMIYIRYPSSLRRINCG